MIENPERDETWKKAILEWQTQPPRLKEEDFAPKPEPAPSLLDAAKAAEKWLRENVNAHREVGVSLRRCDLSILVIAPDLRAAIAAEEARELAEQAILSGETLEEHHNRLIQTVATAWAERRKCWEEFKAEEGKNSSLRAENAELRAALDVLTAWESLAAQGSNVVDFGASQPLVHADFEAARAILTKKESA